MIKFLIDFFFILFFKVVYLYDFCIPGKDIKKNIVESPRIRKYFKFQLKIRPRCSCPRRLYLQRSSFLILRIISKLRDRLRVAGLISLQVGHVDHMGPFDTAR